MSYREEIDEKYTVTVQTSGRVALLRNGENWLENPLGAKAWISVADRLEKARKAEEEHQALNARITAADQEAVALRIARKLEKVWGWLPDTSESKRLGENLAALLGQVAEGTRTDPIHMLNSLIDFD